MEADAGNPTVVLSVTTVLQCLNLQYELLNLGPQGGILCFEFGNEFLGFWGSPTA
ncbi:MAG: hypothetical protein WAK63_11895 [Xanthobacteraceae bacterium]